MYIIILDSDFTYFHHFYIPPNLKKFRLYGLFRYFGQYYKHQMELIFTRLGLR